MLYTSPEQRRIERLTRTLSDELHITFTTARLTASVLVARGAYDEGPAGDKTASCGQQGSKIKMRAEMTATMARKLIRDAPDRDDLLNAVRDWANCREADVSDEGNIWIANPQLGHWLSDDRLVEFVSWADKQ